ncbi:Small ribosomal subunit protein uS5m [Caenorhabditis elegans]|uniref:Small ribosomal subunit protein uS5m n=1 Tax=Caenorhabditis elegans TaxID=6239 RepID=RT05_CAEEL|nr:Small ribosomal subunit protein uS5m [Caenorhabditis elegans]Q93425.3 RecName: Full=Small ribosomal subunit protein uS5m; AltName: Full=28S ribosomal protein S5, mitochondrial [Caenorhabditis elegans]CAB02879.2 Small ribosomal subunit protein uS5m [Caenorhabditis elegans]|eukprot:NP_506145.2 Putative 28S ribosomal protein S5, mitochondrial [Caenorhabditis elegans]
MASLLPFVQTRSNTVNFFMRRSGPELWKTLTSVSKSGQKKGRRNTRQPVRPLNRFYRIGSSPMKIEFAGLNAPIRMRETENQNLMSIAEQTEDEIRDSMGGTKKILEERDTGKKKRNREKLHPMERGFSGTQLVGQKLGAPPPLDGVNFDDFETYCLEVKRTSNMTNVFGRVHTMSALVVTGNGRGLAGYAVGKAPIHRTTTAIINGMGMASRKLFHVELHEGRTIYQDFYAECRNTRVFAQRRPRGFGLTCHPRLIKICEAIGIKDIYVKVEGSTKNYLALTHAFVTGLLNQETHQQLAERKGLHVVEMSPSRHFLPQIVASPISTELKTEETLEALDRLNLDDFYGEGRYPLRKPKSLPFFSNLEGHLDARWRKHPFRNQESTMIRLIADNMVPRWTRDARAAWADQRNERMTTGVEPMPLGIGLSHVVPKKDD